MPSLGTHKTAFLSFLWSSDSFAGSVWHFSWVSCVDITLKALVKLVFLVRDFELNKKERTSFCAMLLCGFTPLTRRPHCRFLCSVCEKVSSVLPEHCLTTTRPRRVHHMFLKKTARSYTIKSTGSKTKKDCLLPEENGTRTTDWKSQIMPQNTEKCMEINWGTDRQQNGFLTLFQKGVWQIVVSKQQAKENDDYRQGSSQEELLEKKRSAHPKD